MNDETKAAINQYMKQYRKDNPEKVGSIQEKYWERKNKTYLKKQMNIKSNKINKGNLYIKASS